LAYPDKVRHPAPVGEHRPPTAPFSADTQALAWLDAERPNLLAAIQHAAAHGPPETAWLLADALRGYFLLRRYDIDWLAAARTGLAAAGDDQPAAQAMMRLSLADRHWLVGRVRRGDQAVHQRAWTGSPGWCSGAARRDPQQSRPHALSRWQA
jgi:hypothetical protein